MFHKMRLHVGNSHDHKECGSNNFVVRSEFLECNQLGLYNLVEIHRGRNLHCKAQFLALNNHRNNQSMDEEVGRHGMDDIRNIPIKK